MYDTRKDSDGGAWRKRTQNTSWYIETLGTATRGTRKEFPAVAVIVVKIDTITIYDGDDPDLPMWMVFPNDGYLSWASNNAPTLTSIHMLNGIFVTGASNGRSGLYADFIKDDTRYIYSSAYYNPGDRTIAGRTVTVPASPGGSYNTGGDGFVVANNSINDVAMTVLPNAPIDDATGLPVPTIAIANDGGVSVIRDHGPVYDITTTVGSNNQANHITFNKEKTKLSWLTRNGAIYALVTDIPDADITARQSDDVVISLHTSYTPGTGHDIKIINGSNYNDLIHSRDNILAFAAGGSNSGLQLVDYDYENLSGDNQGKVCQVTTSFNTGWQYGDIKGAFLSDTDTTNLSGYLYEDTMQSDNASNWTDAYADTFEHITSPVIAYRLVRSTWDARVQKDLAGTISQGTKIIVTYEASSSSGSKTIKYGMTNGAYDQSQISSVTVDTYWNQISFEATFGVTGSSGHTFVTLWNSSTGEVRYRNFRVRVVEEDRSVNNKSLAYFGTITKTAVATGADLVAYSGWDITNGNYLEQSYNSDLDFDTGDYYISVWVRQTYNQSNHAQNYVFNRVDRSGGSTSGARFELRVPTNLGYFRFYQSDGSNASYSDSSGNSFPSASWTHVVCGRRDGNLPIYINGKYDTTSLSGNSNVKNSMSNTNAKLFMGGEHQDNNNPWGGDIALFRIGVGFPSPEQVKKIYEDEKHLFQENANATLYGSSDAVTALAFDDTTNLLHVGTAKGRSDFQGLRRINNTTDVVTTAISASNGLVAEQ